MKRLVSGKIPCLAVILLVGCNGGGLTPNQKLQANQQWNRARTNVLASLAADQYKDGSLDKCRCTLDQALHLEPENASLHLLSAKLSIEQDKLEDAQAHLAEVRRLDPKIAEVDYLSGVILQRWQQPEKACAAYAEATRKDPAEVCYVLAEAEMMVTLNSRAEALSLLQAKALLFEHSAVIRDEIGQLLLQENHGPEAIAELSEASALSIDDSTIREHLGFALLNAQQFVEAAICFKRLLNDPTYGKRADVNAALGECQSQCRQFTQAQASFERATQINPSFCGYWLDLAKALTQLNELPAADTAIRQAFSIDPTSQQAYCLHGYVLLKQKRMPEALAAFGTAAELDPSDSVSVCLQGYVLAQMGRKVEAQPLYLRAMQMNPHDRLAAHLIADASSVN